MLQGVSLCVCVCVCTDTEHVGRDRQRCACFVALRRIGTRLGASAAKVMRRTARNSRRQGTETDDHPPNYTDAKSSIVGQVPAHLQVSSHDQSFCRAELLARASLELRSLIQVIVSMHMLAVC